MTDGMKKFSPVRMTASTEEAAVSQALDLIGATRDEVDVEVLEQGAKGVTVRVVPRGEGARSAPAAPAPAIAAPAVEAAAVETPAAEPISEPEVVAAELFDEADEDEAGEDEAIEEDNADEADTEIEAAPPRVSRPVDPAAQERARALAQEFLDRMGMEAEAAITTGPASLMENEGGDDVGRMFLQIEGNDVGILIGKHGQTLQSLQYLLNLTLNNHVGEGNAEDAVRVVVDAGGYRARRAVALEQSARDGAARAKRDRRSVRLEPMPAYERRLVHIALREDASVTTSSEGREPLRHVVITPAGARSEGQDRGGYGRSRRGYGGGGGGGGRGGYGGGGGDRGGGGGGYGGGGRGGYGGGGGNRSSGYGQRGSR
jgi:spoIIIJ-associated protein